MDESQKPATVLCIRAWILQNANIMKQTHGTKARQEDLLTVVHSADAKAEFKIRVE